MYVLVGQIKDLILSVYTVQLRILIFSMLSVFIWKIRWHVWIESKQIKTKISYYMKQNPRGQRS